MDKYTCEQVFTRLEDYLDRELPPHEAEMVREHLEICAWCASTYAFQSSVLTEIRNKIQRISAPEDLRARVFDALQRARDQAPDPE